MGQIDNFRAAMSKAKGFARPSKFAVRIHPPTLFKSFYANRENTTYVANGQTINSFNVDFMAAMNAVKQLHQGSRGQIDLFCNSIAMPGHDLQTQSIQHGSAPARDMVQSHAFAGDIEATFYLSSDLRERHFFEQWQRIAVSAETHKANYYDDYTGSMEILQLSQETDFAELGLTQGLAQKVLGTVGSRLEGFLNRVFDRDIVEYGVIASEVYPATLGSIEYSYAESNKIATMTVGFNYREWRNLGDFKEGLRPYS
jgi:hypothetical protein